MGAKRRILLALALGAVSSTLLAIPACVPTYDFSSAPGDGGPGVSDGALDARPSPGTVLVRVDGRFFDFQRPAMQFDPWPNARVSRSFFVDRDEVTVARFQAWVTAHLPVPCELRTCPLDPSGAYPQMAWHGEIRDWNDQARSESFTLACGGDPSTWSVDGGASLPLNCVTWYAAAAFCAWDDGKRLLTTAEWRYLATGHGDHREYPWGDAAPDCRFAIFSTGPDSGSCGFPIGVGSAPRGTSVDGVRDLAGSLYEWVWNAEIESDGGGYEYPNGATDYAGIDTSTTDRSQKRATLGGDYSSSVDLLSNYGRRTLWPGDYPLNNLGFRCAKTAP